MNKTEKIISAVVAIALGVLLIALKGEVLNVLCIVVGLTLLVIGILDLVRKDFTRGAIKCAIGVLVLAFGWLIVQAILYVFAVVLLIFGVCWIYELIRSCVRPGKDLWSVLEYVKPVVCIAIGLFLFFNQGGTVDWVFVVSGVLTACEGTLVLFTALLGE